MPKKTKQVNEEVARELLKIVRKTAREEAKRVAEALILKSLRKKTPLIGFVSYEFDDDPDET